MGVGGGTGIQEEDWEDIEDNAGVDGVEDNTGVDEAGVDEDAAETSNTQSAAPRVILPMAFPRRPREHSVCAAAIMRVYYCLDIRAWIERLAWWFVHWYDTSVLSWHYSATTPCQGARQTISSTCLADLAVVTGYEYRLVKDHPDGKKFDAQGTELYLKSETHQRWEYKPMRVFAILAIGLDRLSLERWEKWYFPLDLTYILTTL